jgi:hypothetical protein
MFAHYEGKSSGRLLKEVIRKLLIHGVLSQFQALRPCICPFARSV